MSKVNWESMRQSPASVGAVRVASFITGMGEAFFKPMFWEMAQNDAQNKDADWTFYIGWQFSRTVVSALIAGIGSTGLWVDGKLAVPFDAHGVIVTLATACLAGAAVDWVGLGLQALGRPKQGS